MATSTRNWTHLKSALKSLEDALRCWLCNKVASDPMSYRCSHFICGQCASNQKDACPMCSVPSEASEICPDRTVNGVISCFQRLSTTVSLTSGKVIPSSITGVPKTASKTSDNDFFSDKNDKDEEKMIAPVGGKRSRERSAIMTDDSKVSSKKPERKSVRGIHDGLSTEKKVLRGSQTKTPQVKKLPVSKNQKTVPSKNTNTVNCENQSNFAVPVAKEEDTSVLRTVSKKAPNQRGRNTNSTKKDLDVSENQVSDSKEPAAKKPKRGSTKAVNDSVPDSLESSKTSVSAKSSKVGTPGRALSKRNYKGETPLHVACVRGNVDRVRSLLEAKANPNTKDNAGWTPLHEAANHGYTEIVELLLKAGAFVDVPGVRNVTPLHEAVLNNHTSIAKLLVSHGADIHARSSDGQTPLDLVKSGEMKELLLNTRQTGELMLDDSIKTSLSEQGKVLCGASSLNVEDKKELSALASKHKLKFLQTFGPEVTHLIVPADERLTCPPSMDVLSAILAGVFILSREWMKVFNNSDALDSDIFEIVGVTDFQDVEAPKMSRLNAQKQLPRLFNGCHFYLTSNAQYKLPNCILTRSDLAALIRIGGGILLKRQPDPEAIPASEKTVPYHASRSSSLTSTSHFILYSPGKGEPELKYNMKHCKTLPVEWFVNCVLHWRLLDP